MVKVTFSQTFEKEFRKIRDNATKQKIRKQIQKLLENPQVGKPLRYDLKGERTIYIKPYRLIYSVQEDELFMLRFEHRDDVYE